MLDSKQTAQVMENRLQMRQGRLRTVTLIRGNGSATDYASAQCIWKEEHGLVAGAANHVDRSQRSGPDATAEFLADEDLESVVAIADTPDQAQVASARKFRVREILRLGLTGAPNRILAKLVEVR
jgi:hypothetical protein